MSIKKILYVDMDGVLVDFASGIAKLDKETAMKYEGIYDEVPGIFSLMKPIDGAIESYKQLAEHYDTYILTTSPWNNPSAPCDKLQWVKQYLGDVAYKRIIMSHHKNLNRGDYLIDDRIANGSGKFEGEHIQFGTSPFENWEKVCAYLLKANLK